MFIYVFGRYIGVVLIQEEITIYPLELQQECKWDENEALVFPDMLPSPGAVLGRHTTKERDFPCPGHVPEGVCEGKGQQNIPQSDTPTGQSQPYCIAATSLPARHCQKW